MKLTHGPNRPFTSIRQLSQRQHWQLMVDLLTFFEADPAHPDARRVGEMASLAALQPYDQKFLGEMVTSLRNSGLLYKMPHLNTRAARYVTTSAGLALRDAVRQQLGR